MKFKGIKLLLAALLVISPLIPQSRSSSSSRDTSSKPSGFSSRDTQTSKPSSGFSSRNRDTQTSKPSSGFSNRDTQPQNKPISNTPSKPAPAFVQAQQTEVKTKTAKEALEAAKNPIKVETKSPVFNSAISTNNNGTPEMKVTRKVYIVERQKYYQNYQPPIYINNYSRSYGLWDAIFIWSVLDHMDHMTYYHHHQSPEWQNWRRDANTQALQDPALAAKLAQLDSKIANLEAQKVDVNPSYMPPGVKPEVALAPNIVDQFEKPASIFTCGNLLLLLILFGMIVIGVVIWKNRRKPFDPINYKLKR
jgi:hypothetical protein